MAIHTWGSPEVAHERTRRRRGSPARPSARWALGLGLLLVMVGLSLVHLRTRGIQMRYRLAEALSSEQALVEEQRLLTLDIRRLRDPQRLADRAEALGLAQPERVIALPPQTASNGSEIASGARR